MPNPAYGEVPNYDYGGAPNSAYGKQPNYDYGPQPGSTLVDVENNRFVNGETEVFGFLTIFRLVGFL